MGKDFLTCMVTSQTSTQAKTMTSGGTKQTTRRNNNHQHMGKTMTSTPVIHHEQTTSTMEAEKQTTKKVAVILERELYDKLMNEAKDQHRSGRQQLAHILNNHFEGK